MPSSYTVLKAWLQLKGAEIDELTFFATKIIGPLHTETVIPGSRAIGAGAAPSFNVPAIAEPVGGTTWRSEPLSEGIPIPAMEEARVKLGSAVFSGLANLLSTTVPEIMVEIGKPLGNPLAPVAAQVKPILDALVEAIREAGGMRGFIGKLLYVDPVTGQIHYWLPEVIVSGKKAQ